MLGSIQPQPIDAAADGTLPLDKVAMKIKPDDIHFARTKLLSLENTHNGKVLLREYLKEAWEFTRERNLALHVDGARIFNAVVAYGCELKRSRNIVIRSPLPVERSWDASRFITRR